MPTTSTDERRESRRGEPAPPVRPRSTIALVGTYPPRACGIATFTRDLRSALLPLVEGDLPVIALDRSNGADPERYPDEVAFRVRPPGISARDLRAVVDRHDVGALLVQHEFGIFGGPNGRDAIDLIVAAGVPVITTLHTLPLEPTSEQAMVLEAIGALSARTVVMSERGRHLAMERYGFEPRRLAKVAHGVPDLPLVATGPAKAAWGLPDAPTILSYGLLSPNKGLVTAIDAMAGIVAAVPDARLIIAGATHPEIVRQHGERYRRSLIDQASRLGVLDHVEFIDRYLTTQELHGLLLASDVFIAPYADSAQITSGTLAAALASGRAIVATPFEHALELLADDRGRLVPFADADALAGAVTELLTDEAARMGMRERAWAHGRTMVWPAVAAAYAGMAEGVIAGSLTGAR
ncbi:MAG: glycosyltransferase family 4 protein [Candidatus Limnocylindrales bacterium]